jgi:hypothetical protein
MNAIWMVRGIWGAGIGILNAVGFCMTALLGWVIEFDARSNHKA